MYRACHTLLRSTESTCETKAQSPAPSLCVALCLGPDVLWIDVDVRGPGVHPPAGVLLLQAVLRLLFLAVAFQLVFVRLPAAVPPLTGQLGDLDPQTQVTRFTDSQLLSGVDVCDDRSLPGARAAHQEAAFSAVVSAVGPGELAGAAHADGGGLVWDPGIGKVQPPVTALRHSALALLDVLDPGSLLLVGGSGNIERLPGCADQPLVLHPDAVLQVLQQDVL